MSNPLNNLRLIAADQSLLEYDFGCCVQDLGEWRSRDDIWGREVFLVSDDGTELSKQYFVKFEPGTDTIAEVSFKQ
jgi:hypothetical protein